MSDERRVTDIDDGAARRFAALARTVTAEDRQRLTPPADLWGAIDEAVDDTDTSKPFSGPDTSSDVRVVAGRTPHSVVADGATTPDLSDQGAPIVPIRRRMATVVLSAAAAVALILGIVALVTTSEDEPGGDLIATGALEPLADGFEGGVELVDVGGRLALDIELGALPEPSDAYYELWLIKDLETGEMQSLGPIDGSGRVRVPQGLDPALYATVDISVEPLDGVPTHSGQSVLRGTLDV